MTRRTMGNRVIRFIESYCVLVSGAYRGQPFRLFDWQKDLIRDLFALGPDGLRQYRWALVGTSKKSGKTELAAALGLYFLLADGEPDPLVVVAAASEEQANLVFGAAKEMCRLSPRLAEVTEVYDKEILSTLPTGGKMRRVAAAVGTNDGLNISAAILDELHEWTGAAGRGVWNVLTNGTISRRQPMVFQITTAGYDKDTVCWEQYDYGKRVASGEIADPRFFFRWWEAPEGCDHRDPTHWPAANPSLGVTPTVERLQEELRIKPEAVFRRYFLNQWVEAEQLWLPYGAFEKLALPGFALQPHAPTVLGIDAATRHDSTAVVTLQRWEDGVYAAQARIWERPVDPFTGRPDASWRLPMAELDAYVRDQHRTYPVQAIAYDPAFISWLAQQWEADGLPVEEFPQSPKRMSEASQALYELIVQGRLRHDGAPDFTRHIRSAAAEPTGSGNGAWRLVKQKAKRKMDATIALAMALAVAQHLEEDPPPAAPRLWLFDAEGNPIEVEDD